MKPPRLVGLLLLSALTASAAEQFFDRLEEVLTFSAAETRIRARLSGTLDLEGYDFQSPAPGVIDSTARRLFVPRLSTFLDAQLGPRIYFFAQMRADRGFDPGDGGGQVRLDEYALRITPWNHRRLNVQVGRFATVVGNWTNRHGSWGNPFINAPLPYENLTGIWDSDAVLRAGTLLRWSHVQPGLPAAVTAREKALRVPIVWGPSYATGVAVSGDVGRFRYAFEAKLGSLSSRPDAWRHGSEQRHQPTVSTRLGWRPNPMWDVGISASEGGYLRDFAAPTLARGHGRGDYRQRVLAQDAGFAWHYIQLWTEIYVSRFAIPNVGDADTVAYYAEAKYKFSAQLFAALRWNQQLFGTISDRGVPKRWGKDVWRVDMAPGFRFTPHTQLKFQYSLQRGDGGARTFTRTVATQLTVRF